MADPADTRAGARAGTAADTSADIRAGTSAGSVAGSLVAEVAFALPAVEPMEPVPHRVVDRVVETADVVTITLAPIDPVGGSLAPAGPGQFVMVWVFGVGEIPISVSATGASRASGASGATAVGADSTTLSLTVRSVRAVSDAVVRAEPGDVVGLRGPFGTAWPVADAAGHDAIVVAGGLGLAPLRLAIDRLAAADPQRLTLVVGAREPAQLLYPADLERWSAAGVRVHTTVDAADRAWRGSVGTATALVERLATTHERAFVCGPELMMTSAARALVALGTRPEHVHVSLERNMHCGIGHCGRCQLGPHLLCRDGAVIRYDRVADLLEVRGR